MQSKPTPDVVGRDAAPGGRSVPLIAGALALALLASVTVLPAALPFVALAATVACCALVLLRRPSPALRTVIGTIALWLGFGFAGSWLLSSSPSAGLAWTLAVLFVLPLPAIPWLYARTFDRRP